MRTCGAVLVGLALCASPMLGQDEPTADESVQALFEQWELPDPEDNAYTYYERAFELLEEGRAGELLRQGRHRAELATDVLEANAEALAVLREGLGRECLMPGNAPSDVAFERYAKARATARVLAVEGIDHELEGDYSAAFSSYCDAIKLGQDMSRGSPIIGRLVGVAIEAIACKQIRLCARTGEPTEEALRQVMARLAGFEDTMLPLAHTYAYELVWGIAMAREQFQQAGGPDPDRTAADMVELYQRLIDLSQESYRDTVGLAPREEDYHNPLVQLLIPVLEKFRIKSTQALATLRATRIIVALELCRLRDGEYPEELDVLAPDVLADVPADPFSDEAFVYRSGPLVGTYELYSVGADFADNGGNRDDDIPFTQDGL